MLSLKIYICVSYLSILHACFIPFTAIRGGVASSQLSLGETQKQKTVCAYTWGQFTVEGSQMLSSSIKHQAPPCCLQKDPLR